MIVKDSDETTTSSTGKVRSKTVSQRLVRQGAMQLMILHLQILNEFGAATKLSHQLTHALFQLSGAFRALLLAKSSTENDQNYVVTSLFSATTKQYPQIQETCEEQTFRLHLAIPHLVRAAEISMGEMVVQTNLVRTLSIMSENEECCGVLSEYSSRLGILLGPIGKEYPEKSMGMLVRLGYVLGNIMASYDSARCQVWILMNLTEMSRSNIVSFKFFNNDVAMDYLLSTLESCSNKSFLNQNGEVLDVTIKLVRVIANMSVNNEVGYGFGIRKSLGSILLTLLLGVNNFKLKLSAELEELLLATLGALHNLSFYQDLAEDDNRYPVSSMAARLSDLSVALCATIVSGPISAKAEASRVLGNMTRCSKVRQHFCEAGGLKVIVQQLRSDDLELVAASCGILVNLLGDWERRSSFRELNGPSLLSDVLQHGAMQNWVLAGIICQAMWNYLIDSPNIVGALGENETEFIAGMLSEYLDEETIFNGGQPDELWEQFAIVATDLLERIQSTMPYTSYASSDEDDIQVAKTGDYW
ncbi:Armadillo repeat-containing protein 2, partial [Pseudolycoriella hygida]